MSSDDEAAVRREIDIGLGTIGRVKIMAELARRPGEAFTKYALLKGTGLKRSDLKENLRLLVAINWVREYKSIYPKYQINLDNPRVRLLADFFRRAGYI